MMRDLFYTSLALVPWTGGLIVGLLLLRRWAGRHISPHFFHLAFLVLALRLAFPVDVSLPAAPVQVEMPAAITVAADAKTAQPVPRTAQPQQKTEKQAVSLDLSAVWDLLPYVWALGAVCTLGLRLGAYGVYTARLRSRRVPAEDSLQTMARAEAGRPVRVYRAEELFSPMAAGLVRPAVYLPGCQPDQTLPYVMAHEIRHLKRGDLWFKFLLMIACGMQWFNPLVWLMARAANRNLELACDAQVLRNRPTAYRQAYGMAILETLRRGRGALALAAGFSGAPGTMKERVTAMFDKTKKKTFVPVLAALCIAVAAASALVSCSAREAASSQSTASTSVAQSTSQPQSASQAESASASAPDSTASSAGSTPVLTAEETGWVWPVGGEYTLSRSFAESSHRGVDIAADEGTPIYAPAAGVVTAAKNEVGQSDQEWSMGLYVQLDHGNGMTSLYSHCSSVTVEEGDTVAAGQVIGYVGSTGNSTGNHVHIEMEKDGVLQDPMAYLQASAPQQKEQATLEPTA